MGLRPVLIVETIRSHWPSSATGSLLLARETITGFAESVRALRGGRVGNGHT
jgi:hypothetical protein